MIAQSHTHSSPRRGGLRSVHPDASPRHSAPISERTDEATGATIKVYAAGYPRGYADIVAYNVYPMAIGGM